MFPVLSILSQSKGENREDKSLFLKGERSPEGTKSKCRSKGIIQHVLTDFLGRSIRISWPVLISPLQGQVSYQLFPNSRTWWPGTGSHTPVLEIWSGQCKVRSSSSAQTERADLDLPPLSPKNCSQSCSTTFLWRQEETISAFTESLGPRAQGSWPGQ